MVSYRKGDATSPDIAGNILLVHVCNDQGGWGKGFVNAINDRWPEPKNIFGFGKSLPEFLYRYNYTNEQPRSYLNGVQFAPVMDENRSFWVANMVCQHGYATPQHPCALDYDALENCLMEVGRFYSDMRVMGTVLNVVAPKIGAGLAGGDWAIIEQMLSEQVFDITIYEL